MSAADRPHDLFNALRVPASVLTLLTLLATPTSAQVSLTLQAGTDTNPHTTEADVAAGERVFQRSCSVCHGAEGAGGEGADLTRGTYRHGSSDRALFTNILGGIPGTGMPGVYRPDYQIWQVVSYVRSLSRAGGDFEVPGNPARGRTLYLSRGSCPECHRINGEGGRLGPDLSDIGWRRAPDHIRQSIVDAAAKVDDRYRTARVTTKDGQVILGVLRNEDTYSVQLLDENERLRSFLKSELQKFEKPKESLMPPFATFFRGGDLDDLVAYLYSLRPE